MKHKLSIDRRIEKLERLLKCEADNMIVHHSDDNKYEPKYIRSAQYVCDTLDEVLARLESIDAELKVIHIDNELLNEVRDSINRIKDEASSWI